ncbi:flagellar filament capping protein FliD [Thermodesulfobacteriota bacterium]
MQITGSYMNYLNITSLLSSTGVKGSGDFVMQTFSSSVANLQAKIDQQIFSAESTEALTKLYNEVSDLASKATKLTPTHMDSVFNDRTAISSDINVLTATAWDAFSQNTGATEASYEISVSQLAQAQKNTGLELNSADSSVIGLGINTFNINVNGQDHELSIEVVGGDTNEVVLQKIETAINESALGITAEVIDNNTIGTQNLIIESDNTGLANAFTISDVSGNAIAATATNTISTEAQDAVYSVEGVGQTSGTNTIYLDDGRVAISLKGAGEAVLKVAPNENEVNNSISTFVSEINSFIDFNKNNGDYIKEDVLSSVNSFISGHRIELESMGITQDEVGKLEIDSEKLTAAVNQNLSGIKEVFGGFDGLAVEINSYASHVSTDSPLNYAKEAEGMSIEFADYLYSASAGMMNQILTGSLLNTNI